MNQVKKEELQQGKKKNKKKVKLEEAKILTLPLC